MAREHAEWVTFAMPGAKVKSEEWYPVKCDMVVKRVVLDETVDGGRTLRKEVCTEFAQDNGSGSMDCTAMKASWLSKIDPLKKTGSLVIWLKNKLAADHLLHIGQALFGGGAYGAFCSRKEYFREMEKQKKKHWREFLEDPSNIWKANAFTRIASQGAVIPTLYQEATTAESDEEKADMLMATFFSVPLELVPRSRAAEYRRKTGPGKVPKELP
ncbi:MAG: hypothetical protein M1822_009149 [Bathelium mastoideum]|nr:MAG: hypothetical protein M1822_009149 [Bathelium mastoideum]